MSNRRRGKRRRDSRRPRDRAERGPGTKPPWFGDEDHALRERVMNWCFVPGFAPFVILFIIGLPLGTIIMYCSSDAATIRRERDGPNGEEDLRLCAACGAVTLGGLAMLLWLYYASTWLLIGGMTLMGLVLIPSGLNAIAQMLRKDAVGHCAVREMTCDPPAKPGESATGESAGSRAKRGQEPLFPFGS
jgi:hypothetical protein